MSSENQEGQYVCAGGFLISGMMVGSAWGGTAGAAAGGVGAIPGVAIGAVGGLLWAGAVCKRPAVKRFFQAPIDRVKANFDKAFEVGGLRSELRSFIKEHAPDLSSNTDASVAFMIDYFRSNREHVISMARENKMVTTSVVSGRAKQGVEILKSARPLKT